MRIVLIFALAAALCACETNNYQAVSAAASKELIDCKDRVASDPRLAPLRSKIYLEKQGFPGVEYFANSTYPSAEEIPLIGILANGLARCNKENEPSRRALIPQQAMRINQYLAAKEEAIFELYKGKITFGQYETRKRDATLEFKANWQNDAVAWQQRKAQQEQQNLATSAALIQAGAQLMEAGAPRPLYQTSPQTLSQAMLVSQSIAGNTRYCKYSDGQIRTYIVTYACPINP